jgi:large subunit ribosomal protein L4
VKEPLLDIKNKKVGEVDLDDGVFGKKPNTALIYEVVKMQLANRRKGCAACRNRALVSGTTAKMYRQKGTGRARHGDYRANIFVGGGKAFGPRPRDYSYRIPLKARREGIRSALSMKKQDGKLIVVDDLSFKEIKTKTVRAALKGMGIVNGLLVIDAADDILQKSIRNIPNISLVRWEGINTYDLMHHEHAVITRAALERLQEVLKP